MPQLLMTCANNSENSRAVFKHHGVGQVVLMDDAALPATNQVTSLQGNHLKCVWRTLSKEADNNLPAIIRHVSRRKFVCMPIADGLGN